MNLSVFFFFFFFQRGGENVVAQVKTYFSVPGDINIFIVLETDFS